MRKHSENKLKCNWCLLRKQKYAFSIRPSVLAKLIGGSTTGLEYTQIQYDQKISHFQNYSRAILKKTIAFLTVKINFTFLLVHFASVK